MEHKYKQSLSIFIGLIQNFLYNSSKKEIFPFESNISLRLDKEQFLQLKIILKKIDKSFSPIPPLNFSLLVNDEDYCFKMN